MEMSFRRINGRIVPIRNNAEGVKIGAKVAASAALIGATGVAVAKSKPGNSAEPHTGLKYASYGLSVLSGLTGLMPMKNKRQIAGSIGASLGLDSLSMIASAKSVSGMKGDRTKKAKEIAKQQAIGAGLSYGAFGASLIANPTTRNAALKWAGKASRAVFRAMR